MVVIRRSRGFGRVMEDASVFEGSAATLSDVLDDLLRQLLHTEYAYVAVLCCFVLFKKMI
jgi:hypothetical protein